MGDVSVVLMAWAGKSAVVLGAAAMLTVIMRNASAARRHLVWSAAVVAVLALPVASLVAPAWGVLPTWTRGADIEPARAADPESQAVADMGVERGAVEPAAGSPLPSMERPRAAVAGWEPGGLIILWLAGAASVLSFMLLGRLRLRWLTRSARPVQAGRVYDVARDLTARQHAHVKLLQSDGPAMPMTWGIRRPVLLLPASAAGWSDQRLRAVLQHELAHVRRRDPLWQLLADMVSALHWFNPLAWYAGHRLRVEREHACDDAVLSAGSRASDYASELLEIARSMRAARATSLAAIAMARPRQLEGRLLAVLDTARNRRDVKRSWLAWAAVALAIWPLAAAAPSRAAALPTQDVVTAGVTFQNPDCLRGDLKQMSTSINDDGAGHTRVKWEARNCSGIMEIEGTARMAGDLSGFSSISQGGRVTIETRERGIRRKLTLTPAGGRFAYTYEVNGDRHAWDADGQRWLTSVVTLMVQRGGFGAAERVAYLLREKGVAGVLGEVEAIDSDHVQRRYLDLLLNTTTLNGAAVGSMVEAAGRVIESDHELAQVLAAVTSKYGFTPESRAAYIKAVSSLRSDHERGRALTALLEKGSLTHDDLITVLELTASIGSTHERGQILMRVPPNADFGEPRLRTAYIKAASSMESDYELGRVLGSLLVRGRVAPALTDIVLAAAGSIDSDHERSSLLQQLLRTQTLTAAQRDHVVRLHDEIESEHERGKVASLLIRQLPN